jgi:hypothetical protein
MLVLMKLIFFRGHLKGLGYLLGTNLRQTFKCQIQIQSTHLGSSKMHFHTDSTSKINFFVSEAGGGELIRDHNTMDLRKRV